MSLVFFDGCNAAGGMRSQWAAGNVPSSASTGRSGDASGCAVVGNASTCIINAGAIGELIMGVAINPQWPTGGYVLAAAYDSTTLMQCNVLLNNDYSVSLRRGSTVLATTTQTNLFQFGQWNYMELRCILKADGTGTATVRVDGTTVITFTGQTSTVTANVSYFGFAATSTRSMNVDDIYALDASVDGTSTQGRANQSFLGDIKVASVLPTAAGSSTQWTPSTGANWAAVDEIPPNTTDFVSSATAGQVDAYAAADLPSTAQTVYAVQPTAYASKSDAGASGLKIGIKENATTTLDSGHGLSVTWIKYFGTTHTKKPSDGTVFSVSDVNAMELVIESEAS